MEKSQYSTNWLIRYLKYIDANTKYLKLQQFYYVIWISFGKNESRHFYWNKLMNLLTSLRASYYQCLYYQSRAQCVFLENCKIYNIKRIKAMKQSLSLLSLKIPIHILPVILPPETIAWYDLLKFVRAQFEGHALIIRVIHEEAVHFKFETMIIVSGQWYRERYQDSFTEHTSYGRLSSPKRSLW